MHLAVQEKGSKIKLKCQWVSRMMEGVAVLLTGHVAFLVQFSKHITKTGSRITGLQMF